MAWYFNIENLEDSTKKLLELIHKFSKVTGNRINVWISFAFLYSINETTEREVKDSSHAQLHLGVNLAKR